MAKIQVYLQNFKPGTIKIKLNILWECDVNVLIYRDVASVFIGRESSNDRRVCGPKAHSSVPLPHYI